jgi:hypothetical protein
MTHLPATFTRSQIMAAFAALNLDNDLVAGIQITATQVDVQMYVPAGDGQVMSMLGENATIVVTIPVDEDQ